MDDDTPYSGRGGKGRWNFLEMTDRRRRDRRQVLVVEPGILILNVSKKRGREGNVVNFRRQRFLGGGKRMRGKKREEGR